ncbi:MAG: SCO family protein [Deltaproteobacteria bacterium]|nr:SCO family protein [Deltaproteobacteria bacterium]MBI3293922.1 SCO family protein [Deltaproteobacteria bacterium]
MKHRWFIAVSVGLFVMPIVAIGLLGSWNSFQIHDLPVISQIPDFQLQERSGRSLALRDLAGKVWIGSFIFTRCSGQCPLIAQRVKRLEHDLRHRTEVRFLSFSVDPENDTEAVLFEYAKKFDANPLKWFFVTGEKRAIYQVVHDGFKTVIEDGNADTEAVLHTSKLALVDPWGRVRGYYDANEDADMKKLLKDTRRLIKQAF